MKIPSHIKIGPYMFEIHWPHIFNSKGLHGLAQYGAKKIFINPKDVDGFDRASVDVIQTFFHETVHALDHAWKINLTEDQTDQIATAFLTLLVDNLGFDCSVEGYSPEPLDLEKLDELCAKDFDLESDEGESDETE